MLRRRRRESGDQREPGDLVTRDTGGPGGQAEPARGPWDAADDYPAEDRIDCGSLQVPAREGFDVQLNMAPDQGPWVAVVRGESGMQIQAFAAPRSGGLWEEIRQEITGGVVSSGGSVREEDGPHGPELIAWVPVAQEGGQPELQPVRFIGFDGPRWFLHGVISGPAARDRRLAEPFDDVFADVVVVRGDYPAPPREQLEIRLPEDARQALEAQFEQENPGWELPNPFARGPEITETR